MRADQKQKALDVYNSGSWTPDFESWTEYCLFEFGMNTEDVEFEFSDLRKSNAIEETYTALAEHLACLVGADKVNAFEDDQQAVDGILSSLSGSRVQVLVTEVSK